MPTIDEIDALLPQTQCGECGFKGCRPYASALAQKAAPIDRCPPGGVATLRALGALLHCDPAPYEDALARATRKPSIAVIREAECIGCTKCIQACPVDAIIGSAKQMHVILSDECTGCGLCVLPCPVDCIDMVEQRAPLYDKAFARARFNQREIRLLREEQQKEALYQQKRIAAAATIDQQAEKKAKQDYILRAMARVNAKRPPQNG
jgi:electron transport complex protein RnfB